MKRKKIMATFYVILGVIAALAIAVVAFVNQPSFGKQPSGKRLERMKQSWHYKAGEWKNEVETQKMTGDGGFAAMWDFLFGSHPRTAPDEPVEAIKTDVKALPHNSDLMVWFGHSSYLLQLSGKRILVDPVLVDASPVSFVNKAFKGSDIYRPEDMPTVDYMIITHDHWDHLDYDTQQQMRDRIGEVVVPLGIGENFEYWGFAPKHITDLDWYEQKRFADGFTFHCMPARHFSGRGLKANQALWGSFVIEAPDGKRVYVGGDSGYGPHFRKIGDQFPGMTLAILENGQYNKNWSQIHTMPAELPKVMSDLKAQHYITVHHGKYTLSTHPWDEPLQNEQTAARNSGNRLTVLKIGEVMGIE